MGQYIYDGTCLIATDNTTNLQNFGPILGFDQNRTISTNTKTESGPVNINSVLKFIRISFSITVAKSDSVSLSIIIIIISFI